MLQGTLKKMITEYKNPINYFLNMDKGFVHLNYLKSDEQRVQQMFLKHHLWKF